MTRRNQQGRGRAAWFTNPNSAQYRQFQRNAMNPYGGAIRTMRQQLAGMSAENDPYTQALQAASQQDPTQNPYYQALGRAASRDVSQDPYVQALRAASQTDVNQDPYVQALNAAMGKDVSQDPYVQALRQASQRDINQDPAAQAMAGMLANAPSSEQIGQEFGNAQERLAKYMQGVDYGAGGKGVGDITSMLGTAIGADLGQTKDIAQTAGTVSGMGGQGGDVYSKALLGGAAAAFEGQKAQRMSDVEARKQDVGMQRANLLSQLQERNQQYGLQGEQQLSNLLGQQQQFGLQRGQTLSDLLGQNRQYGLQAEQTLSGLLGQQEQYGLQQNQLLGDLMGQNTQYGIEAGQAASGLAGQRRDLMSNIAQMRAQNRLAYDPFKLPTAVQGLYGNYLSNLGAAANLRRAGVSTGGFTRNPTGGFDSLFSGKMY